MTEDSIAAAFDGLDEAEIPDSVDRAALERMRTVAKLLDESVPVPGTDYKVGLDPLVGAIPVVGDAASAAISLYIVAESARLGVSFTTLLKMLATVGVDTAAGMVPYVGPVFDAVLKSNKWNLEMAIEDLLTEDRFDEGDEAVEITVE